MHRISVDNVDNICELYRNIEDLIKLLTNTVDKLLLSVDNLRNVVYNILKYF